METEVLAWIVVVLTGSILIFPVIASFLSGDDFTEYKDALILGIVLTLALAVLFILVTFIGWAFKTVGV